MIGRFLHSFEWNFYPGKPEISWKLMGISKSFATSTLIEIRLDVFLVSLVFIARKLWEEKPIKKWRNNNNNILYPPLE